MAKRIIALILCLFTLVAILASCAGSIDPTAEYKGEQITMYLSETVYDLDPARAYKNDKELLANESAATVDALFICVEPTAHNGIEEKVIQMTASFITGAADLDTQWDAYIQDLNALGLEQLLETYQNALERYNTNLTNNE